MNEQPPQQPKIICTLELQQLVIVEDMLNELPRRYDKNITAILNFLNQFTKEEAQLNPAPNE